MSAASGTAGRVARQAWRDLLYMTAGAVTSSLSMVVFVAGLSITLSLAIFIVAIPVVIVTVAVFRAAAGLDRRAAAIELGAPIPGRYRPAPAGGIWARSHAAVLDPQVLRDAAWLAYNGSAGFALSVAAVAATAHALMVATVPLWYALIPDDSQVVVWWQIESFKTVLLTWLLTPAFAALAVALLRGASSLQLRVATTLLGPAEDEARAATPQADGRQAIPSYRPEVALPAHAVAVVLLAVVLVLVWLLTTRDYFWPMWPLLGLALSLALHLLAVRLARAEDGPARVRVAAEAAVVLAVTCVAIWAMEGGDYFWPIWPAIGMLLPVALAALIVLAPWRDNRGLERRVDVLTRTRRDAIDAQATELRRIERDLHDGAQARLVALSMQLGRAEARLAGKAPDEAALVREARGEASAAIAELRDLARGIAPPVLADRGLIAAVEALAQRSPVAVTIRGEVGERLPPSVENCAYFVCSEAITNVAKHAPEPNVTVDAGRDGDTLRVTIADDGPGGADPGAGSGLTGLAGRVAALDGTLTIVSPLGAGTTIDLELPCA